MKYEPTLHKLSNGTTVILDHMDLETVAVKVSFSTGSRDEKTEIYGITHFCEHMLFKGTEKFPTRKLLKDYIENKGGAFNASTSDKRLVLHGRIIAENTKDLLEIFADMLKNSLFDDDKIEIERNVIMDELRRSQSDIRNRFVDLIDVNLFGFSAFRTIGSKENIKSFTREQMIDWLHKRLSGKNCTICISGRIDDKKVLLEVLENLFSFLPNHDVSNNKELNYTPCDRFLLEPSLKNVRINILFPCTRPDTFENIYADMAESKFHKYLIQELGEVLRQQNGLTYGLGFVYYGNELTGVQGIGTETAPENIEQVVALIAKTAYRVYTHDKITDDIIKRFYNISRLADADFLESASRRRDILVSHWKDFEKLYDYNRIIAMNKSITAKDVIEYSKGFFDGPMSIITFGAGYDNLNLHKVWTDNFK